MALPPTIQTIVGLIGHALTMTLVRELGGQDFRFPAGPGSESWDALVEIVGGKAAVRLCDHYLGDEVYIALCDQALRADRNRRLVARYDALLRDGRSSRGAVSILVQEFRPISNRTVETIVNGPTPAAVSELEVQGQLF